MPGDNLPQQIEYARRGPHSSNRAIQTANRQGLFNLKGDRVLSTRQDFDPANVWNEVNGGTITQEAELYTLETDDTQTNSQASLESARLGVYRSGVENEVGCGVYVDERPTGDGEVRIGYGINDEDDGIYHVIQSDDWQVTFERIGGEDVDVSREAGEWVRGNVTDKTDSNGDLQGRVYGLDPLTGSRDSRFEWVPGTGYVYGLTVGWYGPLSTMAWVDGIANVQGEWAQRRVPLFLYRPINDPAFTIPNRPIHVSVDNGSTAETVKARVGGRQYTVQGQVAPTPERTFASVEDQSIPMDGTGVGPKDWYPVCLVKRKPGFSGAAIGIREFEVSAPTESLAIHSRVIDPTYISGEAYEGPDDVSATQTALEFDMAADTPTRVDVETWTDSNDGDKVKPQGIAYAGDHVGTGAKNEPAGDDIKGSLEYPIVREFPTVFFVRTRSGQSDEVDGILKTLEVGA